MKKLFFAAFAVLAFALVGCEKIADDVNVELGQLKGTYVSSLDPLVVVEIKPLSSVKKINGVSYHAKKIADEGRIVSYLSINPANKTLKEYCKVYGEEIIQEVNYSFEDNGNKLIWQIVDSNTLTFIRK